MGITTSYGGFVTLVGPKAGKNAQCLAHLRPSKAARKKCSSPLLSCVAIAIVCGKDPKVFVSLPAPLGAQALVMGMCWIPIIPYKGECSGLSVPSADRGGTSQGREKLAQGPPDHQGRAHGPAPQGASPAPCSADSTTPSSQQLGAKGLYPLHCTGIELV